jgi:hypothetical protein
VSAANAILDRGYGKPRQLEPETISPAAKAEQDAEAAAKHHEEVMQYLDELLSTSAAGEEEQPRPNPRPTEADALPQRTTGWDH